MKHPALSRAWLVLGCVAAVAICPVTLPADVIVENFKSVQFRDSINTTAWWDTTSGQLKLHPFQMEFLGSVATHGFPYGSVVVGEVAYVATQGWGMQVVDISDPTAPAVIGDPLVEVDTRGIDADGHYAYIAGGNFGLAIVDVRDVSNPTHVITLDTPVFAGQVDVSGDKAYVADQTSLLIIDVATAGSPVQVGQLPVADCIDVSVDRNYAYVANRWSGLWVVDVADSSSPTMVGSVSTPELFRLVADGHYVYTAHLSSGIRVVDVSDPTAPAVVGQYNTAGSAYDIAVSWPYAYVADWNGVVCLDVSDFANIQHVGTLGASQAIAVTLCGSRAYVGDGPSFRPARVAAAYPQPLLVGALDTRAQAHNVTVSANLAFVADGDSGMHIMDVTDPANPQTAGGFDTSRFVWDVDVVGGDAFIADGLGGFGIVDVSDPASPQTVSWTDVGPQQFISIVVVDHYAYLGDIVSGFYNADVADRTSPVTLKRIALVGQPVYELIPAGDYIYGACALLGLTVFSIADRADPTLVTTSGTPHAYGLAVDGDRAYIADRISGLFVFDITNPAGPVQLGSLPTPGRASGVWACGDDVYLADDTSGVHRIDVSDPANPVIASTIDTPGYALDLCVVGDHAFVTCLDEGLQTVQVFDRRLEVAKNVAQSETRLYPTGIEMFRVTSAQVGSIDWGVSIDGGLTWEDVVPDNSWHDPPYGGAELLWRASLHADGVTPPTCDSLTIEVDVLVPVLITSFDARASDAGVELRWNVFTDEAVEGFQLYRREDRHGADDRPVSDALLPPGARSYTDATVRAGAAYWYTLSVVESDGDVVTSPPQRVVTQAHKLWLGQNEPNPFNPQTNIAFRVASAGHVTLSIHSVDGRRVRTLVNGRLSAGPYKETWDGRDDHGETVASGVYFYRLSADRRTLTRKMTLLK